MKRTGHLIEQITVPDNLRLAYWKSSRGKESKSEVKTYQKKLDKNLAVLRNQILTGNIDVGHYHYFTIYDPKERIICAASLPERVLHHALMNVCHEVFERFLMDDSFATRIGKGTYAALERAQVFQRQFRWFLKLDIKKYFDSIDHSVLMSLLAKKFKDEQLLNIFGQMLDSYHLEKGKGLPIGNLTSQYFANFYLGYADWYIKQNLKIPGYVRYMDDMVLWSNDKKQLKSVSKAIRIYLKNLLKLELKVSYLNSTEHGVDFLGYRLFKYETTLNKRSKKRFLQKFNRYKEQFEAGFFSESDYQAHLRPLFAFVNHAKTFEIRKKVLEK